MKARGSSCCSSRSTCCSFARPGATTTASAAQLSLKGWRPQPVRTNSVIVPISGIQRAVVEALDYAKTLSGDVRAVYVNMDAAETERLQIAMG